MEESVAAAVRFVLDVALKATVLLSLVGLALAALKRKSASVRQLVATLGLAGALALPGVTLLAPRWEIPLLPSPVPDRAPAQVVALAAEGGAAAPFVDGGVSPVGPGAAESGAVETSAETSLESVGPALAKTLSPMTWMLALLVIWSAGTLLALTRLALGAARVRRICRRASCEAEDDWTGLLATLSEKLDLARSVRLLFSEELAVPVTTGLFRPVVLLPEGARRWSEERRRVVLLHELAHVKRADWLALMIGQGAAALYWFHPLAWSVRGQMRKDCERACDDLVLAAGTRASAYAAHLLSIIRSLRLSKQRPMPAVAMAHRSYWDRRMRAILDPRVERRGVSGGEARLAAGALFGVVVGLAVLEPWASRNAEAMSSDRLSGFALSATEGDDPLPGDAGGSSCDKPPSGARPAAIREKYPAPDPARRIDQVETLAAETAAEAGFVKASRKSRKSGGSSYGRAMELHHDERYDEAIEAFRQSIEEGHRVEASSYNIACGYARKGDADRAFEWLEKATDAGFELHSYLDKDDDLDNLRSDPRFAQLRQAARAKKIEESRDEAAGLVEKFGRLKASPPKSGSEFYGIGKELLEVGHYDLAAQAFEASAARGYKGSASLYNTACALSLKGDRARALDFLEKSLEAGFDDPALMRKDDDLDNVRGQPRYRELLRMAEDLSLNRFPNGLGDKVLYRSARREAWREVEKHFEDYTRTHPKSGRALFNLGYARIQGDRAEEAAEAFRRALELGYRKPTAMYNLACAYSLMDRKDEAFRWLFQALDAGFGGHGMLRSDDDLDNLRGDARFRQALARAKDHEHDDD